MTLRAPFVALALLLAARAPAAADSTTDEAELRRIVKELGDAIAPGEWAVWDRYLDERVVYAAEDGRVLDRAALKAEFRPLPAGFVGTITPGSFLVRLHGDVAIVSHVDQEQETIHGQALAPKYLTTDTFRRTGGGWKLIARQVLAVPVDPPAIPLSRAKLAPLAGRYQLAPGVVMTVSVDGDHLVAEREGRPRQELRAETDTVFFVPGQPRTRKIFVRDGKGRVMELRDRREGHDLRWTRAPR